MRTMSVIGLAAVLASSTLACSGSSSEAKSDSTGEAVSEKPAPEEGDEMADDATADEGDAADEASVEPAEPAEPKVTLADANAEQLEAMFSVSGSVDKGQVKGIIGQNKDSIYQCYKKSLPDHPGLAGKVLVSITSSANGQVVSAVIKESTIEVAQLKSCMTGAIKKWKFPEPTDGGLVMTTYPFVLPP